MKFTLISPMCFAQKLFENFPINVQLFTCVVLFIITLKQAGVLALVDIAVLGLVSAPRSRRVIEGKLMLLVIAHSSALDCVCEVSEMAFCPNFSYI